jgi:hypothetical protein
MPLAAPLEIEPAETETMSTDDRPGARRYTPEELEEIGQKGDVLFDRLREKVWNGNEGKFIAIHVDTGEFAIGRDSREASLAVRAGRPADGRLYVRRLSDEPDYSLASRILAGEMAMSARK